ncbi:sugar ABC transporter ATP-binding protein [candidate division KSB3 bacterium]|uniref:Sugar ABC transporter ATP-binding protein n=1 Tax=candidate division KSB3 bacterium TaxID=2044937 RepID=A0A2G6ECS7_9BACT|nr:MAG: sugar ABC transporter ATP-binding protein [candidate division KSB3 bacterium]
MNSINLQNVSKSYGGIAAVKDLNLDIEERQFLTLLGPSGCGKTTTLRIIAGLEEPDDGEVIIRDEMVFSMAKGIFVPPEKRKLGLIFQSYALWPHMTVRKNVSLALEEMKLPRQQIESRVREALEKVQLTEYVERFPSELSGGQQQRVAVARMIAAGPGIFLMDEPLSNLDAMLRIDMRAELKHLHHELEATTVYVTHDQVEALTLSDKIAVMHQGVLRQLGTPEEIYKTPADLFVAKFVGSPRINVISGTLVTEGTSQYFVSGKLKHKVDRHLSFQGKEVLGTIRPEDLEISTVEREGWLKTRTYSVLPAGSETIVTVENETTSLAVKVNGFTDIKIDDELWLSFNPLSMNYYDPHTEQLIVAR